MRLRYTRIFIYFLLAITGLWLAGCSYSGITPGNVTFKGEKPTKIVLLLPLQGQMGNSGQAVRNGFLTAYYYAKQGQANAPTVDVVDTSGGNIVGLYQQAVAQGADFIVGPLNKQDVKMLASQDKLTVPTLALNTLDNNERIKNLYQFGLSPKEEAAQAAVKARHDGRKRALVLYPSNAFGQGIAAAFEKSWQSQGGDIVAAYAYPSANLANWVRNTMGVARTAKTSARGPRPAARQDMDMIFLVGFPQQARQIMPLLAFYNSNNTPVYATSLVYGGSPDPQNDHDLNGIQFSDMPWLLGPDTPQWAAMRDHIKSLWADSYNHYPRFYAFGIDAYHLTYRLGSTVQGATGTLSLDQKQIVNRQLQWASMQNGVPQLLP